MEVPFEPNDSNRHMILTDGTHLVSDQSEEELHAFAKKIGLKLCWYQRFHYDLTSKRKFEKAISAGAILVTSREVAIDSALAPPPMSRKFAARPPA